MILPEQGTDDWKKLRVGKCTATKLAAWMGLSPYRTAYETYCEELGLTPPQEETVYMRAGSAIEPEARRWFLHHVGIDVSPKVVFSASNGRFMASLDGISDDGQTILEIKKNNIDFHEMARSGKPHPAHNLQMQWQMFCADVVNCHYLSYRRGDEVIVVVHRDDQLISQMIAHAHDFLHSIDTKTPPPLCDRDYVDLSDVDFLKNLALQYDSDSKMAKFYQDRADATKEQIKQSCGDRCARGSGWKLTKSETKGKVDYQAILNTLDDKIDVDLFRKDPTYTYRITVQ